MYLYNIKHIRFGLGIDKFTLGSTKFIGCDEIFFLPKSLNRLAANPFWLFRRLRARQNLCVELNIYYSYIKKNKKNIITIMSTNRHVETI